jgi:di/tricarboxylate transporter
MTVAIAASTAFSTPVASPVNTLILGPGGYRFKDFAKVGIPLQILAMAVTLVSVPLLYGFIRVEADGPRCLLTRRFY